MEQFFKSRSTRSLPALFPLDTAVPAWPARAPHWPPSSLTLTSSWYSSQSGFFIHKICHSVQNPSPAPYITPNQS